MGKKQKAAAAKPDTEVQKPKKGRPTFELVGNANAEVYPFKVPVPDGFDFAKHRGLKKKDFNADHIYLEYRALEMEAKAVKFRAQAEEAKKVGSKTDRAKVKRLAKLQEKMDELKKQLVEQGIDVEELLAETDEE